MEKKRILLIDDQKSFSESTKLALEEAGKYEVGTENDGSLGITAAKEFKPDLILLDVAMPDMTGSEVAFQLKSDDVTKDIPIVFLTGVVEKSEVEKGNVIGGYPFVAKPVDVEELVNVIEENINPERNP